MLRLPAVLAAMANGGDDSQTLARRYAAPSSGASEVAELAALVAAAGGRAATERYAAEHRQRALEALRASGVDESVATICETYADLMVERGS